VIGYSRETTTPPACPYGLGRENLSRMTDIAYVHAQRGYDIVDMATVGVGCLLYLFRPAWRWIAMDAALAG